MNWQPPERSAETLALLDMIEADAKVNPDAYTLSPDAVLARALRDTPPEALGPDDWAAGFTAYLASAERDGELNALGRRACADMAVGRLRARLALLKAFDHNPRSLLGPSQPPLFIIGGWRTGTTFLQRTMAQAPGLRALFPWELGAPWKAASADADARAKMAETARQHHDRLHALNSRLQAVHDSGPDLAEECVLAMGSDFRNWGFMSNTRLDSYAAWLEGEDFAGAYRTYRAVLGLLERDPSERFVLKAPAHTAELASLAAAFPQAVIVWLHRDVVETVASGASLFAVFRSTYSDRVDPADVGAYQARQTARWFNRALDFRAACEAQKSGPHFIDLAYSDLVADPRASLRRIHEEAGLGWTSETDRAYAAALAQNRQHRHGKHSYSAEEFGLSPRALETQFARYRARFGV